MLIPRILEDSPRFQADDLSFDDLLGIPFKHTGRHKDGLDCWGLVIEIYSRLGIEIKDPFPNREKNWAENGKDLIIKNYYLFWEKIESPKIHDLVFFKVGKLVDHIGVITEKDMIMHAREKSGVVRTSFYNLRKVIHSFYKYKND